MPLHRRPCTLPSGREITWRINITATRLNILVAIWHHKILLVSSDYLDQLLYYKGCDLADMLPLWLCALAYGSNELRHCD